MKLAIDFGTTNSSIAMFDGSELHRLRLDAGNDNPYILPSLIYIDRQHTARVGTAAAAAYLESETGRTVSWERRRVGEIDVYASDMHYVQDVNVMVDAAAQGRLLQYVKTGLRDPMYQGTQIFDRYYTVDELVAIILRHLKSKAEEAFQTASHQVVIGRPVRYSDDDSITRRAEEIMFRAARLAGFDDVRFALEPVGAAYSYHRAAIKRQIAFIFDFGGGTLDFTIAELGGKKKPKIIATHGVLVGGDDLDRRIMQSLRNYFGAPILPAYLLDLLDNWQTMPELSRSSMTKTMDEYRALGADASAIAALKTLVTRNVGFKLFRSIEQTKKQLSSNLSDRLDFDFENISIHETIAREQFEALIDHEIEQVEHGVLETLKIARLTLSKIDIVLRTGGTSAVPVFTALLARTFGEAKLAELDLFTSVVGGLAVIAHEGGVVRPRYAARYDPSRVVSNPSVGANCRSTSVYAARVGEKSYSDAEHTIARMPVDLSGLPAIRLEQADKADTSPAHLAFDLIRPARVFVAYDATAKEIPTWLRSFSAEKMAMIVNQYGAERLMQIYSKDFPAGRVALGANLADGAKGDVFMNYLVIVRLR
jgi:hypothetical chaperone protein